MNCGVFLVGHYLLYKEAILKKAQQFLCFPLSAATTKHKNVPTTTIKQEFKTHT